MYIIIIIIIIHTVVEGAFLQVCQLCWYGDFMCVGCLMILCDQLAVTAASVLLLVILFLFPSCFPLGGGEGSVSLGCCF